MSYSYVGLTLSKHEIWVRVDVREMPFQKLTMRHMALIRLRRCARKFNLTRWSRVLRDTAASQLNDALRARLRDWALVRVTRK